MSEEKQKNTSLLVKTNSEGLTGSTASASRPRNLVHSVSIIVETCLDDYEVPADVEEEIGVQKRIDDCQASSLDHDIEELQKRQFFRTGRHQSTPIIFREDHVPGTCFSHFSRICQSIFQNFHITFFPHFYAHYSPVQELRNQRFGTTAFSLSL